jgi:acetate kinase
MGLTPMEGLVMGTRCGDVDPGLVLHLIRAMAMSAGEVDDLLNHRSGLLALSGRSGDVRELSEAARAGDALAEAALESFAYRARKYVGAYAAAMGGLDAVAFAGGIGEHSADVRARVCRGLEFLGVAIDLVLNEAATDGQTPSRLSGDPAAMVQVWAVPTDEEGQIARELYDLLR